MNQQMLAPAQTTFVVDPPSSRATRFGRRLKDCWPAAAFLLATACGPPVADGPVVILVTLDTTRADYLGCYGASFPGISPRIDELATEGVLFTQAISQAAVTPVSHASIMTGLWPYHHGLRVMHGDYQYSLGEEQVTLAEILQERGYDTGAFVSALPVTAHFGFQQGFDRFDASFTNDQHVEEASSSGMVNTGADQRHAGDTTDLALTWIDQREAPFFLWLHYFDVHDEQVLPPEEVMRGVSFSTEDRERRREVYRLELTYMDQQLGRVFDKLKELGLWDDAVVVVTADHGEGLGDHDWWTHGILYQEQVRVPMILKGPGLPMGKRIAPTVRSIDIVPTIAQLLNFNVGELPVQDGVSLVPLMDGTTMDLQLNAYTDSVNTLVYNFAPDIVDTKDDLLFGLVLGNRWKYIRHLKSPKKSELYDLQEDPHELDNLFLKRTDISEQAKQALKAIDFLPVKQLRESGTPQDILDRLRAMGYTDSEPVEMEGAKKTQSQ